MLDPGHVFIMRVKIEEKVSAFAECKKERNLGEGIESSRRLPNAALKEGAGQVNALIGWGEVQVSVARYLRTPPYAARRKGLDFDISHSLRCESHRSFVVVCN